MKKNKNQGVYKQVSFQKLQEEAEKLHPRERIWKTKDDKKYLQTLERIWITADQTEVPFKGDYIVDDTKHRPGTVKNVTGI